jgi:hypothetical protein
VTEDKTANKIKYLISLVRVGASGFSPLIPYQIASASFEEGTANTVAQAVVAVLVGLLFAAKPIKDFINQKLLSRGKKQE